MELNSKNINGAEEIQKPLKTTRYKQHDKEQQSSNCQKISLHNTQDTQNHWKQISPIQFCSFASTSQSPFLQSAHWIFQRKKCPMEENCLHFVNKFHICQYFLQDHAFKMSLFSLKTKISIHYLLLNSLMNTNDVKPKVGSKLTKQEPYQIVRK